MQDEEQDFLVFTEVVRSREERIRPKLDLRYNFMSKTMGRDF